MHSWYHVAWGRLVPLALSYRDMRRDLKAEGFPGMCANEDRVCSPSSSRRLRPLFLESNELCSVPFVSQKTAWCLKGSVTFVAEAAWPSFIARSPVARSIGIMIIVLDDLNCPKPIEVSDGGSVLNLWSYTVYRSRGNLKSDN